MIRYVTLNPTGNLTCLVLDPVAEKDRGRVTNALINRCEQVGYLEAPKIYPGCARARLQMMGGEFCGNATMGTAAWLAMQDGLAIGEKEEIVLEVSGAEMPVFCMVCREIQGWTGRVDMPPVLGTEEIQKDGKMFTAVHMTGMTHLIHTGERMKKPEAEANGRAHDTAGLCPGKQNYDLGNGMRKRQRSYWGVEGTGGRRIHAGIGRAARRKADCGGGDRSGTDSADPPDRYDQNRRDENTVKGRHCLPFLIFRDMMGLKRAVSKETAGMEERRGNA